ncbi:M23 family metallopeptidase [Fibrobacter sp. UWB13]|uniref:M23 family metallopeptidase n=1 Tax=Fibrobacter sp. UWB13 TaxID=1896204 RepID=UPI000A0DE42E|nr:M23 family metallopeptidase [Fibrobacter sp. UWB13]SMG08050.1 Peptidase family M23 [Fibrobacter sp. UWB13]
MVRLTKISSLLLSAGCALSFAGTNPNIVCDASKMDAFAYEDCIATQRGAKLDNTDFSERNAPPAELISESYVEPFKYDPFNRDAYLTSSFGENRGTRYHAGIDYSTQMEEGWPIYAPENGFIKEIKTSPFGYGKVMFYEGNSGKTWVFAHQSSFTPAVEDLIKQKQYATKSNDISIKPNIRFRKGDTLTFAGSTGIGNPHLHLEVRLNKDDVTSPCQLGVKCLDTIAPQIFGIAVWQGNELALTTDEALRNGCAETPVKNEFNLSMAIKIADYSREPKENPMAIRRLELWRYDDKIYSKVMDTLSYKKMLDIRNELLWAEEADTAGDWHYINAKLGPISTYRLEIEDFSGHIIKREFNFHQSCKDNGKIILTQYQNTPLYTFLSKSMLDIYRCESGYKFTALNKDEQVINNDLCKIFDHNKPLPIGKIVETFPETRFIQYSADAAATGTGRGVNELISIYPYGKYKTSINWYTKVGNVKISQKISGIPVVGDTSQRVLAVTRNQTDSVDFYEFHPKGLQFYGKWNVCIENEDNPAPLYWLGETTRRWFYFEKQTGSKNRCASTNELRDLANISDEDGFSLGFPYWAETLVGGMYQSALKIPLYARYAGIPDGNAITVKYGNKWIAAEYDSEPREIILLGDALPDAGETISIEITDDSKRKTKKEITIPGF